MSTLAPRRVFAGLAAAAITLSLSGCFDKDDATRDSDTNEVTEAGEADVFTLAVGDCFDDEGASGQISDVPAVPCADAHDNEVYYSFDLEGDEFPGDDVIQEEAATTCTEQFETFAGIAYDSSVLDWFPITPTQGSWEQGDDREILCVIYDTEPVEGSLEGAAR